MEGATIQPFVHVGNDVVVGPRSSIGHDTTIGDHCFLGSRANLSGEVGVEPYCVLGPGSTIRSGHTLAREWVISAGVGMRAGTAARGLYVNERAELMILPGDKLPRIWSMGATAHISPARHRQLAAVYPITIVGQSMARRS